MSYAWIVIELLFDLLGPMIHISSRNALAGQADNNIGAIRHTRNRSTDNSRSSASGNLLIEEVQDTNERSSD